MAVTARRTVREIPRAAILHIDTTEIMKLVVVAYARVSTEKEEQEDSFERQVSHYTTLITSKPEWSFGGIYADPGITGTRAEKRPDFMRMIADCRAGKINKILVKSISRFARNTVDALNYIRELKELGISIYFENENIDTLTPGGEVLITILAAMAEQESRTMSTNIKWTYQKKFKNGEVILNTGLMLGYTKAGRKDEEGREIYEINEAEATIVRRIYREYLAGTTITRICRGLEEDGIPTKLGKKRWQALLKKAEKTYRKWDAEKDASFHAITEVEELAASISHNQFTISRKLKKLSVKKENFKTRETIEREKRKEDIVAGTGALAVLGAGAAAAVSFWDYVVEFVSKKTGGKVGKNYIVWLVVIALILIVGVFLLIGWAINRWRASLKAASNTKKLLKMTGELRKKEADADVLTEEMMKQRRIVEA